MQLDDGTLQQLVAQLSDEEPIKRWEAVEALRKAQDGRAVGPLLCALHDASESVRHAAAMAVGQQGEVAFSALQERLTDKRWDVREAAVMALGASRDERTLPLLIEALQDDEGMVAVQAAVGLSNFTDGRIIAPLIAVLGRWDPLTEVAAKALGRQGEAALQPLLDALRNDDDEISTSAAEALGYLGDRRAVEAPIAVVSKPAIRLFAVEALGRIGDPRAITSFGL